MESSKVIDLLQQEPALSYKLHVYMPDLVPGQTARNTVRNSTLIKAMIAASMPEGKPIFHPYRKWAGGHWVLAILADLGYPSGDKRLGPLVEQAFEWILSPEHARHIRNINGRTRRCASQEGNLAYSTLSLGLADERTEQLISRLIKWQWNDGGWNCDKRPEVSISSFMESLIPLRALALATRLTGDGQIRECSFKAADIFLKRSMFKRLKDGKIMDDHFIRLHYPCYWHYDILFGLKVIMEAGLIDDPRCQPALELLESRRLEDGGYPADETYYHLSRPNVSGFSPVSWGGVSKKKMNPFVTMDALVILKAAGRI
jgi:hypothetical protein